MGRPFKTYATHLRMVLNMLPGTCINFKVYHPKGLAAKFYAAFSQWFDSKQDCPFTLQINDDGVMVFCSPFVEVVEEKDLHAETDIIGSADKDDYYIGVDLDGTLAYCHEWNGIEHIGKPIPAMLERVKKVREEGYDVRAPWGEVYRTHKVKLFTARATQPGATPFVKEWLELHDLGDMEITCIKDSKCLEYWDDRARRFKSNTGEAE